MKGMDRELLDPVHELRRRPGTDAPVHAISGDRSPATIDDRRHHRRGVAGDKSRSPLVVVSANHALPPTCHCRK